MSFPPGSGEILSVSHFKWMGIRWSEAFQLNKYNGQRETKTKCSSTIKSETDLFERFYAYVHAFRKGKREIPKVRLPRVSWNSRVQAFNRGTQLLRIGKCLRANETTLATEQQVGDHRQELPHRVRLNLYRMREDTCSVRKEAVHG